MAHIPGFTHPVQDFYAEDIVPLLNYSPPTSTQRQQGRRHGNKWRRKAECNETQEELDEFEIWCDDLMYNK